MSNSHTVVLKNFNAGGTYGQNLWRAFQIFLAALFAVQPKTKPSEDASEKIRQAGIREMHWLAKRFDATMPNQAAELRSLAARGNHVSDE